MRVFFSAVVICVSIGGCADIETARREKVAEGKIEVCEIKFPTKVGNYSNRAKCLDGPLYAKLSASIDSDLIQLFEAKRTIIASNADTGLITPDAYILQISQARSEMVSASEDRQSRRASNAAAIIGASGGFQPYVMQPNRLPVTTNCFRVGNSTSCTSQ